METVFLSSLKSLFDVIAEQRELYIPHYEEGHFSFVRYEANRNQKIDFNELRVCQPAKQFLFPLREIAAVFPEPAEGPVIKPFAVYGLKDCDLRAIQILDKVFAEEEFCDPSYLLRRENMLIISSDCYNPSESCFCLMVDGEVFPQQGYDLNISKIKDGYIIRAGSDKGLTLLRENESLFADVPHAAILERDDNRVRTRMQSEEILADYQFDVPINQIMNGGCESELFDNEAKGCVECQACTRICPTCHCFYLYDEKQRDYYQKMKIWDSCVRLDYATVAGGENPRRLLTNRTLHRLMHKFVFFLDRYGIQMCVGCGRCIDACAGETNIRDVLKKLYDESKTKNNQKLKNGKKSIPTD
ncbi:MAG: 4Fe-4S dicluster domain-containing protein [Deltaproteobacteria bacterium]|nr:4Fe-4S dicluster domain-containing protein [Deltaproteobacteria bacterium]